MRHLARTFSQMYKISMANNLQYRVAMFIWLIGAILEPLIYLIVWTTVANLQGGAVAGFTAQDFAAYYIVLMVVNQWTFTWIMWEYEFRIKDGTLARYLLLPIHPIVRDVADNVAYKVLTSAALIPAALLLTVVFRPGFDFTLPVVLAFAPALLLAFALRFVCEWTLALAAFWTTRISAINQIYFVALIFFSGRLAPLQLMPGWVQALATALPFRWMVEFPVEVAVGHLTAQEILLGYTFQVGWLLALLALLVLVWRAGVRQFSAVGG